MMRTLVSALVPLGIWAGCESNVPPNTVGQCQGLITVALEVPGGVNEAKAIASTLLGPDGTRYNQVDTPPLPLPNVVLRARDLYRPGQQFVRVVAAEGDPARGTASSPIPVQSVARAVANFQQACPSLRLVLQPTRMLDICFDRCDAEVRCGQVPFQDLEACQARCRQNEAAFAQQQADWVAQYQNAHDLIRRLEGCTFVSCADIEACGETVQQSAIPKP
ncbi:MAG: hypothetical protein RMK29_01320 [Myxococcales bacterium]|nr:hypothetical protein [Myxococcota bacterium]MDW8280318.1 hypothetical protein [Myxococcales bacterium]